MSRPPFPIERLLVPAAVEGPSGFTKVEQRLVAGLPATIALSGELSLVLTIPTGLANTLRDIDPHAVVTQSFVQTIALPAGPRGEIAAVDRTPARLMLVRSGVQLGSVPLVAGLRLRLPTIGSVVVELIVLGWEIRAGSLRGAGDFGSSIRFVWRRADSALDRFLPPPISPNILSRLRDRSRGASELGTGVRRLPAGYGLGPPPAPEAEAVEQIEMLKFVELEYAASYTTYDVP
jgi:hypothetical protein